MPFRCSYLAMKWPFISFIFLRLLFTLLIIFDSFFFFLCFCISFTLTFQFSHLFYYSRFLWGWYFHILCFHISLPFPSDFYYLIFYSEVREEKGIYGSWMHRKYAQSCVWICAFFLFFISGFWSDCLMPVTAWNTHLFIRSSYTQRLLHTYIEEFSERWYSVCRQVSWKYFPPLKT